MFQKMWSWTLLTITLASVAHGDFIANHFMDQILNEMRVQVTNGGLDPLRANPFNVFVRKNGAFNHDCTGQFLQGSGYGLSNIVRLGDCTYGPYGNGMKLGCNVALSSFKFMMNADIKGDTFSDKTHSVSTSSQVHPRSYAVIEVQGTRGFAARLDKITVPSITLTTNVIQGKIDLNSARFTDFVKQVNGNLATQLAMTLTNAYSHLFANVVTQHAMP
ncbi:uncharacterized protein LOC100904931 [Galendromus occidentalis]|uniref:Uncharacterized protein LOC100904931 n=1 Tax=Galendromus occidentalis TaxID=34638 RepID=A0AAJ6QP51_9ACAR|nr:uncharacterized protein LOC100904931 [Galendromus occidentalis]